MPTQYAESNPIRRRTYEGPLCLHELIAEQAERTPDRVAVTFESDSLTYRELLKRTERLARHLRRLGVGPDARVGVCAERSLEMVVGLLGVLKAGGAYVPLDPSYPAERLAFMVEDAAAPVVLTQRRLASLLPPHGAQTVLLDEPSGWRGDDSSPLPPLSPLSDVPPDALAYVIYTSGSTGRPKGAMNCHRAVRNRLLWMRDDFGLGPDEVVLQKTPFSFDLSVWEIFATLMTGARLVMARPGGHQDSAYLVDVMEREGITIAHFVPSMLRAFLSAPGLERCTSLRRVLCTGEAVSEDLERRFFERFGVDGPKLYNLYGPTEAAVEVTWWQCGPGRSGPVPIGRPLPNTTIHIVGPDLEALPPGGEGELLIGGIQPARGYHGRPELTAEKLIPDPFSEEPGMRLYRTGDLARFRPDGVIDFLGRLDFQVKVRGYRIELGEIESALGRHPAVHEAVAVARERNGEMRLAAYVVPSPPGPLSRSPRVPSPGEGERVENLRAFLAQTLPDYMVPSDWVFLEALPLTASGKIDRKALPEPQQLRPDHVPPRTALERFLTGLWEETLGAETVGVLDNFFDLGGTSISGAVVVNRLQSVLGDILHVVVLFDAPTIGELASYLAREHRPAVVRVFGEESAHQGDAAASALEQRVDEARLRELRNLVPPLAPYPTDEPKNPPILLVLAPPRSGTTLLRVMLAGHPGLFSPPELELLTFNTMDERHAAFQGRDAFWLEGVLRAVMELRGCSVDEARELVEACEGESWTTRRFYRQLQEWSGSRLLVDKSTNYPLDPAVLRRAEDVFEAPFYVHLVRHPCGMIHSFEEAKIDQVFFRRAHRFARRELAELIWTVSQRNILEFLAGVPGERQHRLGFEDLVRDPEGELRRLCAAIGIQYHPEMADPYRESRSRMTDGVHAEGRMLGDMKFHEHKGVDASVAERWRDAYGEDFLGEPTWQTAAALGYPRDWGHQLVPLPRSEGQSLPLSSAQERLWFLDRLVPGSPVYNSCRELRLHGQLDADRFARAVSGIVRRHEALRTVFPEVSGSPVQRILPAGPVPLPVIDLSGVRKAEQLRVASVTARQPFNLLQGRMLRCVLLRLGAAEHALRLDIHHIATDGWSFGILQRELEALYRSRKSLELPEPAMQYADFAVWQRRWLEREGSGQLQAWRRHLEGLPPALELPADRPRPPMQSLRGGLERAVLPPDLGARLEQLGRRTGSTPFMTLLASFQTLLHRISGRDDLAVGVPSANRGRRELEGLIGFFVNNLVMRVDLAGDPTFEEALGRVRESALFAYAHQDLPFERLVAELVPERDLSRTPLFQVAFSLQESSPPLDLGAGLRGDLMDVHTGTSKFDLWLQIDREPDGWSARAEYATDLFDGATVGRWLGHLRVLLAGIAVTPNVRLSELSLLTLEEIRQLTAWNQTAAEIPDEPVHRLFRRWAERTPQALAISWNGGRLTYAELAARVDSLAQQLRDQGVGPEVVVALRLERSPELIIAALAVLEAGGAYLPIDPANPAERIQWIVEDSGAIEIKDNKDSKDAKDGSLKSLLSLKSLAYVIYTSGSTGAPKGTEISHRSLSSLIAWHRRTYRLEPSDRTTLLAGPGFDASVWETWAPLTSGASLHIPPPETLLSPPALLAWMAEQKITVSFLPTPLAEAVLAEPLPKSFALRVLLTGGDRLRLRPAPDLPFDVINHYGPTENTVVATAGRVAPRGERPPEIGSPIANVQVQVVDRNLRLVPAGVPGELCLAGEGLARGYLRRPELTAERFVPNPFGDGERLYRSGDLARWLPSGQIEFLGRIDHQVKIRGYRIELGEIEATLTRHEAVRESAVLALDGKLVAYVATKADLDTLRAALSASLPDYMIPTHWVFLDALPLTANGKVDRQALARLTPVSASGEGKWVAPVTEQEKALADIWSDLLGLDRIGRTDDFFALGGHSLLAARLAFRVRERFGVDLPLREIFEAPALSRMAERIEGQRADKLDSISRAPRPAPASFAQQRLWFIERLQPGTAAFNMPFVLRFSGPLDVPLLEWALRELELRHETLRTALALGAGTEPVQIVAEPGSRMLPLVDLSELPERETEAARLVLAEARRPFDLEAGPLLRTALLRLSEEDGRLLVTMHHAIADGWSLEILFRELAEAYRGAALPPLPVQYSDFAAWQRSWLSGERLQAQLAFWLDHLAGRDGATELVPDRPRPAVSTLRGARESVRLPDDLCESIENAGRRLGATPFVTFLSVFQAMVHRYTGREDLVIGSAVAGRPRAEVEGLIGLFVNMLPIRARVESDLSFAALLEQTREAMVAALSHQDLPFERLVAELEPRRDLSRHPVFQLVLVVEDSPAETVQLAPGLTLAPPEEVGNGTAKLDLILAVKRTLGGSVLEARYASDLFDASTMRRLLGHFHNLMQAIVAGGAETLISDLSLLDEAEREQVLAFAGSASSDIEEVPVHHLVRRWAERTPDAPAVVWEGGSLTYSELVRRADALAHHLQQLGVGPETLVALRMERSAELVTAALGVLETGAAYLPIDPANPEERIRWIVEDSGALTPLSPLSRLPDPLPGRGGYGKKEGWGRPSPGEGEWDGGRGVGGEGLAYVIYTSGSTGTPKGSELCHRGLSSFIAWHNRTYQLAPEDRMTLLAGPGFDASVLETWAALTAGASLHVPPREVVLAPAALLAWLAEQRITVSFLPTPLAEAVLAEPLPERLALRYLMTGGDRLRKGPSADLPFGLVNVYGPTETTIVATAGRVERQDRRSPDIGKPIANTRVYVLDSSLQPQPVGVPGELYLAGDGLARAYRGRPALTAERFLPHPLGDAGERLYRTGDLARWLPDGRLDFLGRIDHQVKIRGIRIELGEIETVLAHHPAVREVAVLALEGNLVAWLALRERIDKAALRSWLAQRLPEAMVPAKWGFLDELPLTPNGKMDRRALSGMTPSSEDAPEEVDQPRNPIEELLATLFGEILGLGGSASRLGDFFELGGHSLLAVRLAAGITASLPVTIGVRDVFERSTVAGLAECVAEALHAGRSEAPPLVALERGSEAPLSFAQERLWFLDRFDRGSAVYNLPLSFHIWGGDLGIEALQAALGEIVRRHEVLRTTYRDAGGQAVQVVQPVQGLVLPVVDLRGCRAPRAEAARVESVLAVQPFDLVRGPVVRSTLLRLASEENRLVLSMHHIASDGWSIGVLLRELSAAYRDPTALPALPVQYADYAIWQRGWLSGEALAAELAWWRERLTGLPAALDLPSDRPRPTMPTYRGDVRRLGIRSETERSLAALGRRSSATLFMTTLAAFASLLHRWTGEEDLVIGAPVANRDRLEVEGLIGFFVNTLALRIPFAGDPSFADLLAIVRKTAIEGYAHQEVPFERLVAELAPERDPSRHPIFQVSFSCDETRRADLILGPGLTATVNEVRTPTAKFDLSLHLSRVGDDLLASAEYSADLFDASTVERFLGHFQTLLAGIAATPEARISDLPILTADERAQLRITGSSPPSPLPSHSLSPGRGAPPPAFPPLPAGWVCDGRGGPGG